MGRLIHPYYTLSNTPAKSKLFSGDPFFDLAVIPAGEESSGDPLENTSIFQYAGWPLILEYTGIYWNILERKIYWKIYWKTAVFWGYTGKYTGIS